MRDRFVITLLSGQKVRTTRSRRYFVLTWNAERAFVLKRTDNLQVARREKRRNPAMRVIYDSETGKFIRDYPGGIQ